MTGIIAKIEKVLASGDPAYRAQAVEMILTLADPAVDDWVLTNTTIGRQGPRRLDARGKRWSLNGPGDGRWLERDQEWPEHDLVPMTDLLPILRRAPAGSGPAAAIRDELRHLRLAQRYQDQDHGLDASVVTGLTGLTGLDLSHYADAWAELHEIYENRYRRRAPVTGLTALAELPALALLAVHSADRLDLGPLAEVTTLRTLTLIACDIAGAERLPETPITRLEIAYAPGLTTLRLPATLRELHLRSTHDLVTLDASACTALEEIIVEDAPNLTDITTLATAAANGSPLRRVTLEAAMLSAVDALAGIDTLEAVDLSGCAALTSIAPLGGRPLAEIKLAGCANLGALDGFPAALGAAELSLSGCAALTDLTPILAATDLTTLDLRDAASVTDLAPLADLPGLRVVAIRGTGVPPGAAPPALAPLCTWARNPDLGLLGARPRP